MEKEQSSNDEFTFVIEYYLRCRSRGSSLSTQEMEYFESLQQVGLKPQILASIFYEIENDCKRRGASFPRSFATIQKKINATIQKLKEY